MEFNINFALNEKFIVFMVAILLVAFWQIMKFSKPGFFDSIDPKQKEKVGMLITMVNLVTAIVTAFILTGFGMITNFWDGLGNALIIFSSGAIFDVLKAYGIFKE